MMMQFAEQALFMMVVGASIGLGLRGVGQGGALLIDSIGRLLVNVIYAFRGTPPPAELPRVVVLKPEIIQQIDGRPLLNRVDAESPAKSTANA